MIRSTVATALVVTVLAARADAAQLWPTSYDMLNGETGYMVYRDESYSGLGDIANDLSPLTGGRGDLTDGIFGTEWDWGTQDVADPWVGWRNRNPVISFDFGQLVDVTEIRFHTLRNTPASVYIPPSITIATESWSGAYSFTDSAYLDLSLHTLSVPLGQSGTSFDITIDDFEWAIFSEIEFIGRVVPEPATWVMCLVGLILLGTRAQISPPTKARHSWA